MKTYDADGMKENRRWKQIDFFCDSVDSKIKRNTYPMNDVK